MQASFASSLDDDLLHARASYYKKNVIALSEDVTRLQNQNYILAPYAEYWLMLLNLEEADNQTVTDFLNNYNDYPFADRLRGEYLKKLAKNQDWLAFSGELPNYHAEDAAITCYAAEANAVVGDISTLEAAKPLWLQAKEQPGNCNNLYDRMQAANVLSEDNILQRLRLSLENERINLAKGIIKRSKSFELNQLKLIDKAYASPKLVLNNKLISFKTKFGRELNLFALNRLIKTNSQQALAAFNKVEDLLPADDVAYFYGRLALFAAQRHEPQAVQWFQHAENATLSKDQLAWFARAALFEKNWPVVLNAINAMDETQAMEGAWRYWKARALSEQANNNKQLPPLEANTLFAKLSTERHFYGWLAQDELDGFLTAPLVSYKASDVEIDNVASLAAFQRVDALQRVDLKWEAKAEWALATKDFDDKELLAAAEFASRKKWYDLAIATADKTTEIHDFALRYPTPYRDLMKPAAAEQQIDEAWVYGISRQESRFMHYAKSGVGASGLMQLMPATAKWIAGKAGVENYNNSMIHELDTNIALGTYYLGYTLALMNSQPVMATAAYNAGPSRAKKWAAAIPLEGAIYAETIPFTETRLYVQKVMANAHLYAPRLGLKTTTLKQRMGVVPAASMQNSDMPVELAE
jgi:soluble lytic murein transglycosylase